MTRKTANSTRRFLTAACAVGLVAEIFLASASTASGQDQRPFVRRWPRGKEQGEPLHSPQSRFRPRRPLGQGIEAVRRFREQQMAKPLGGATRRLAPLRRSLTLPQPGLAPSGLQPDVDPNDPFDPNGPSGSSGQLDFDPSGEWEGSDGAIYTITPAGQNSAGLPVYTWDRTHPTEPDDSGELVIDGDVVTMTNSADETVEGSLSADGSAIDFPDQSVTLTRLGVDPGPGTTGEPQEVVRREANPPLEPVTIKIRNTHTTELVVLLVDRRRPDERPIELRIPPGKSKKQEIDRDAGGADVRLLVSPTGETLQELERQPIDPETLYDVVVYENAVLWTYIDHRKLPEKFRPPSTISSPRSLGVFALPEGDRLEEGSSIDAYEDAVYRKNPGAAAQFPQPSGTR